MTTGTGVEDLLRDLAPQVLGAVLRRYGTFGAAEDAVQEALLAAAVQWPAEGLPDNPRGWLITVAARRLVDWRRRESARREKEAAAADWVPADDLRVSAADSADNPTDDSLTLLFLCCHPTLPRPAQVALTLRAVGGLSTAEIARAYLVPEATMAQRISRAKRRLEAAAVPFALPDHADRDERFDAVLQVLYLIFNEGYTATSGPRLQRTDLTVEAIRLTRQLDALARRHDALLPDHAEVRGLLALMLLTDARREARVDPTGALVPLAEQDRSRWDAGQLAEGLELITGALSSGRAGPYQVQAAIAALHAEAASAEQTDWMQILALYRLLERLTPTPVVLLNQAVALAMVDGPLAGLALLDTLEGDPRLANHHRLPAVRAHLAELAGDPAAAQVAYERAARATTSVPEQTYLRRRAARLAPTVRPAGAE